MTRSTTRPPRRRRLPARLLTGRLAAALALSYLAAACVAIGLGELGRGPRHGWWDGLGVVLPHDTFPADCDLCHVADDWSVLRADFSFDHLAETGVALDGAHASAQCLRCHNDRGPSQVLGTLGCVGCHEDVHFGQLGSDCAACHDESTWEANGQLANHDHSRFPLVGIHASTSCRRCHTGADVGNFTPIDNECVTCHRDDLARAQNPDHAALGWVQNCDACHVPLHWNAAELDPDFAAGGGGG